MPDDLATKLQDVVLPDQDGEPVALGELWSEHPVALVWLRHYGWVHCRDHAVQVHRARERFEQAGIGLVLIGQASPRQAAAFRRKLDLAPTTVLADEDRVTYKAAGLRRGNVAQLLGPQSALAGVKHGLRSGVVQGRVIGDAAQLGGAAVIAPGGRVLLHQAQRHAGDTIDAADLLAAA